ncbi:hypothetical protein LSH36_347g01011 [Paralvinella palmiformis]|uniref:Uncharacterized protein n=1 Tax=Paralvinella palmiformis TaxID=53620 RepID=A0AAD9N1S5_9ANNE|nr:hypothetical protein LSH36_347g01011 [Paralvinella palmiformis]
MQQFYIEEITRPNSNSGLKRVKILKFGQRPHLSSSHVDTTLATIHNRPSHIRTPGLGEMVVVLNGIEFQTRHKETQQFKRFKASENIEFPDVPPEVLEKETVKATQGLPTDVLPPANARFEEQGCLHDERREIPKLEAARFYLTRRPSTSHRQVRNLVDELMEQVPGLDNDLADLKTTFSAKSRQTSYAIPLEIIYLTPLKKWNPHGILYRGRAWKSEGRQIFLTSSISMGRNSLYGLRNGQDATTKSNKVFLFWTTPAYPISELHQHSLVIEENELRMAKAQSSSGRQWFLEILSEETLGHQHIIRLTCDEDRRLVMIRCDDVREYCEDRHDGFEGPDADEICYL